MRHTLKKSEILRGRNNFQTIFKHGRKIEGKYLRCLVLFGTDHHLPGAPSVVFGVSIPRIIQRAVDRNRIKRLIKESYRLNKQQLEISVNQGSFPITILVLYAKKSMKQTIMPTFQEIDYEMKDFLRQVIAGEF